LGNIEAGADGVAKINIVNDQIPIFGPGTIVGRALVLHEGTDDLGKGGNEGSLATGNAGGRVVCAVLKLTK
jgi:Cu-Zn family superoxide dismutase